MVSTTSMILPAALLLILLHEAVSELTLLKDKGSVYCISSSDNVSSAASSALTWLVPSSPSKITRSGWLGPPPPTGLHLLHCSLGSGDCGGWREENKEEVREENNLEIEEDLGRVLDHRWNDFPVHHCDGSTSLALPTRVPLNLHVSVLSDLPANLLLTSSNHVVTSPLYRLNQVGVERCPGGVASCPDDTQQNFTRAERRWVHYTVRMTGNATLEINLPQERTVQTWRDLDERPLEIKFISCKAEGPDTYWRLHKYEVLRATGPLLLDLTPVTSLPLCLDLTYFSRDGDGALELWEQTAGALTVDLPAGDSWRTVRLEARMTAGKFYRLSILTPGTNDTNFYVGDIRVCSRDDLYVSELKEVDQSDAECVSLSTSDVIKVTSTLKHTGVFECPGAWFGPHCSLSCQKVLGRAECSGVFGCDRDACSCMSGYQGRNCDKRCCNGYYGPNCHYECGRCSPGSTCDSQTGSCPSGCEVGWWGPLCISSEDHNSTETAPPETPSVTTQAPKTTLVTGLIAVVFPEENVVKISWKPPHDSTGKENYLIFYKHEAWKACKNAMRRRAEVHQGSLRSNVTEVKLNLKRLEPFSRYSVHVEPQIRDSVGTAVLFQTPEDTPSAFPGDLTVTSKVQGRLEVTWTRPPCDKVGCDVTWYQVAVDDKEFSTKMESLVLDNMTTWSNHVIKVRPVCHTGSNNDTAAKFYYRATPNSTMSSMEAGGTRDPWMVTEYTKTLSIVPAKAVNKVSGGHSTAFVISLLVLLAVLLAVLAVLFKRRLERCCQRSYGVIQSIELRNRPSPLIDDQNIRT